MSVEKNEVRVFSIMPEAALCSMSAPILETAGKRLVIHPTSIG